MKRAADRPLWAAPDMSELKVSQQPGSPGATAGTTSGTAAVHDVYTRPADAFPCPDGPPRHRLYEGCRAITEFTIRQLFDFKSFGVENVPAKGGVMLASNHQSYLDPVLVGVRVLRPQTFLAKSELFGIPGFKWLIESLGAIPIQQGKSDRGALVQTVECLQSGHCLNMYPEGARANDGNMMPLEKGIGLLVRRAKVPVVPVAIVGSFDAWPRGSAIFRPGNIRIAYGRALWLHHLHSADLLTVLNAHMRSLWFALQSGDDAIERYLVSQHT